MSVNTGQSSPDHNSALGIAALASIVLGVVLGLVAAFVLFPDQGTSMAASFMGSSPKGFWYLSRASAFAALGLLWLSMMLGLLITDKMAKSWPGAPVAFALHEFVSLLGLAFGLFHALILLGDRYINYTLAQILMPFGSVNYHPVWVGVGQIGFYTWAIISATFYIRQHIGSKAWKFIHYLSFFNFAIAVMHGIASGTDSATTWAQTVYWVMAGSFLFLTVVRVIAGLIQPKPAARPVPLAARRPVPAAAPVTRPAERQTQPASPAAAQEPGD
jgi:predicted ferric reductase